MGRSLLAAALLLAVVPHTPAQGAKPDFKIVEKTKDGLTYVELDTMPVKIPGSDDAPLELTAEFTFVPEGGRKVLFPFVTLGFTSRARASSINLPHFGDAVFVLDGKELRISGRIEDTERLEGTVTSFAEPSVEWVDVLLPLRSFTRIAEVKSVEVRIGSLTFRLSDNHLKALLELDGRIRAVEARAARPPLVGNISDEQAYTGCGCHFQFPSERRAGTNRYFFKADGGQRAWMNIGGRDVELRLVGASHMSLKSRRGQRMDFRFRAAGGIRVRVRVLVTRTSTYETDYEPARYAVVVEAAKGGRRQVVTLRDETCGC